MVTEFERTKRDLEGRSIMITSWYDAGKHDWRASAPAYAHVHSLNVRGGRATCPSRKAAIDHIIVMLAAHFAGRDALPADPVIFL
jgi:hypothetical protein